jgi:hypothetical protein
MQLAIIGLGVVVGEVTAQYQGLVACLPIFKLPISIDSNNNRLRRQPIYKKRGRQFLNYLNSISSIILLLDKRVLEIINTALLQLLAAILKF